MRLFVAIAPPIDVARALLAEMTALPNLPRHRATPDASVHLTVQFIGDVSPRELSDVEEAVERSASGLRPFLLQPLRIASLPLGDRVPARLLAVVTDTPPELMEIHRRLAGRLARPKRGRLDIDKDRFLPHLTLCRFEGSGIAGLRIDRTLSMPAFPVDALRFVRSVLLPAGAVHDELRRISLSS